MTDAELAAAQAQLWKMSDDEIARQREIFRRLLNSDKEILRLVHKICWKLGMDIS